MSGPNINSTESCNVSLSLGNCPFAFMLDVDDRLMLFYASKIDVEAEIWVEMK